MRFVVGLGVVALVAAAVVWVLRAPPELEVRVSQAEVRVALDAALAEDPHVGRLPRVRFSQLTVEDEDGLILVGEGRWFSIGAGGVVPPDVALRVEIPADPAAWTIRAGGLAVTRVALVDAERLAFDGGAARPESEANRRGWERLIVSLFGRMDSFGDQRLGLADWGIVTVATDAQGLLFTLRR